MNFRRRLAAWIYPEVFAELRRQDCRLGKSYRACIAKLRADLAAEREKPRLVWMTGSEAEEAGIYRSCRILTYHPLTLRVDLLDSEYWERPGVKKEEKYLKGTALFAAIPRPVGIKTDKEKEKENV